jgi:hypothetical protein
MKYGRKHEEIIIRGRGWQGLKHIAGLKINARKYIDGYFALPMGFGGFDNLQTVEYNCF